MSRTVLAVTPLEHLRRSRGLQQRELAALSGVSRDTISRIERGYAPSLATANALVRALGADLTIFASNGDER